MASVTAGSRLRVEASGTSLVARSLRRIDLDDDWVVPVLLDAARLPAAAGEAVVEFPTDSGPVRLAAEFARDGHTLVLRAPGLRTAAFTEHEQRRENVRGEVHLPLRGTVLAGGRASTADPGAGAVADLTGTTTSVSAGGLCVDLAPGCGMAPGARIYVELGMPNGDLAPAVLSVLECEGDRVRARFTDISPLDRERLVRLVFARQRAELAERRRAGD